eukprot:326338-Chlamydomonas_euryale.AAC.5
MSVCGGSQVGEEGRGSSLTQQLQREEGGHREARSNSRRRCRACEGAHGGEAHESSRCGTGTLWEIEKRAGGKGGASLHHGVQDQHLVCVHMGRGPGCSTSMCAHGEAARCSHVQVHERKRVGAQHKRVRAWHAKARRRGGRAAQRVLPRAVHRHQQRPRHAQQLLPAPNRLGGCHSDAAARENAVHVAAWRGGLRDLLDRGKRMASALHRVDPPHLPWLTPYLPQVDAHTERGLGDLLDRMHGRQGSSGSAPEHAQFTRVNGGLSCEWNREKAFKDLDGGL